MTNLILDEIERGWELFNEGKLENALYFVQEIEKKEELTQEMNLRFQVLKGMIILNLGRFEEALKIAEKAIRESKKLEKPVLLIESLFIKFGVSYFLPIYRTPQLWIEINNSEKFLKTFSNEPSVEIEQGKFSLNIMNSWFNWYLGELDLALELLNECLEIFKRYKRYSYSLFLIFLLYGHIYENKGELELALKSLKKCLEHSKINSIMTECLKASALHEFGAVYYQQGNLDLAIKYYKESLEISEHIDIPIASVETCWAFENLIKISLDTNSPELAREYLQHFNRFNKKHEKWREITSDWYKLSEARILKSSTRIRDRAEAEKVLREVIEESKSKDFRLLMEATIEICDYYLGELNSTNDLKILDDIKPFITSLLHESERSNSYSLQSHTNLLQGKLSLLQINMANARQHLTQAQRIAEEHGLQLLARAISTEHDALLEQLEKWETMKKSDIQISERLNLASIGKIIDLMQGKRELELTELINEEPILLLIMGGGGVSYFTHSFIENWDYDDLFSSFMSAFNTFSSEIFSESIDRIKMGGNLILIKPVEPFLVCYVIKGQSYPALQRLNRFSDVIKWNTEISEALNKSVKTGEMLELNNPSSLGDVVNEIFNIDLQSK